MPLLRKTGARSPWMPGPLLPFTVEQVKRAIVVAALLPPMLFGGTAQWVGARPLEAPPPAARPARVVQQPIPMPGAIVLRTGAVLEAPDRLAPTAVIAATPLMPGAQTLALRAPRDESVAPPDRVSPTLVVLTPLCRTDATLRWVGALRRDAADRAGQRVLTVVPAPPLPWASAQWLRPGLDPTVPPAPNPIICALAALSQQATPHAVLARLGKPTAAIAPAARTAVLTQAAKPRAALARAAKPIATLEPC